MPHRNRNARAERPTSVADSSYARIYSVVAMIPEGCVATYGQVAELAGLPRQARQVGYALAALDGGHPLPWHRVINARGEISTRARGEADQRQRILLENEGVAFDSKGRVALSRFRWRPETGGRGASGVEHE